VELDGLEIRPESDKEEEEKERKLDTPQSLFEEFKEL